MDSTVGVAGPRVHTILVARLRGVGNCRGAGESAQKSVRVTWLPMVAQTSRNETLEADVSLPAECNESRPMARANSSHYLSEVIRDFAISGYLNAALFASEPHVF